MSCGPKPTQQAERNVYEGQYKDNKKNGRGCFTFSTGDVYEGQWKDNMMHGQGRSTFADGNV
jgi:hypothetical protein